MGIPYCIQPSSCPYNLLNPKTLNNIQHTCTRVIVDEDGALVNSTDTTNLLVDDFNISIETTGGDVSLINGDN